MMRSFCFFCALVTSAFSYADKPPVILISIDGFAHNYLTQFKPKNILALAEQGVSTKALIPVFPSKTFPNHLSIITGTYPAKHGIVHNRFYSPKLKQNYHLGAAKNNIAWLTALPLWAVAEQQGVTTAVYFWPESEANLNEYVPTYNMPYKKSTLNKTRIDKIITWLKLPKVERPAFITSYFSIVDSAGHSYGTYSNELRIAINEVDEVIGYLIKRLRQEVPEEVNIILVSDHGMTAAGQENAISFNTIITDEFLNQAGVTVVNGQTQIYVYFDQQISKSSRNKIFNQLNALSSNKYQVYSKATFPQHWHFNQETAVIPDIIVNANPPFTFVKKGDHASTATHGYDVKNNSDLAAIFIASGPSFKSGVIIEPFENIHIFPLISHLLSIQAPKNIDGDIKILKPTLKSGVKKL